MPPTPDEVWSDRCRGALSNYSEPLLRTVAAKLIKPRVNQAPEDLLDKSVATFANPPVIDRRIRELPEHSRKLLALIALSRQQRWKVGHLITLLTALGHAEGFTPVADALVAGLLFPELPPGHPPLVDFAAWFGGVGMLAAEVFAHPAVSTRARAEELGLPDLAHPEPELTSTPRSADGLDWLLRLAAVWQQVNASPVRFTQANTLFKKDLTRLQADDMLSAPSADLPVKVADSGVLALLWAVSSGLLADEAGELRAVPFPATWDGALAATLTDLFAALPRVEAWDPLAGYNPSDTGLSPTPTAGFLALLLLAKSGRKPPNSAWVSVGSIAEWMWTHHPSWAGMIPLDAQKDKGTGWVMAFLIGVAFPLQLVEVSGENFRLSPLGRHLLAGDREPGNAPTFPQTLLVQPNAEILAYRQGLTPALIGTLSRFAQWKGLGPACTLVLTPEQTYHGLESGLTLPMIVQALTRHSSRPVPPAVADLLQRWASKRERITIFASAVLVEFATPAELDAAVARGIVAIRLTERIGITADGTEPALTQLRLIANRDYEAKPQRCVTVAEDGVTLTIDAAIADLLLDAELGRFATLLPTELNAPRRFRLNPELLRKTVQNNSLADIDGWFIDRTGQPLSPAGRLLMLGPQVAPPTAAQLLVVRFPSSELADGVMQWPETRLLVAERLGPMSVVVHEENLVAFRKVLLDIGVNLLGTASPNTGS
ncbi:MAG: helicase-associated domain-containing protein [Planctomycetes bacterium]|nr:helicase-associated domain-containing protein [Planctomycetota bacterium]